MDPAPDDPTTLGRYRVQSRLGAGGMGRVLLGVDAEGRHAALKLVHAELASDPGFRERFRHEVQAAASAPPWFTAAVLDADPDAERPWLATEFVEGPSLQAYITTQGPLGAASVSALAERMADGLAVLHAAGLVHRDLKPSNVLLADDGPRLIDFGISRAADTTSLTQTGHVMGTPEYMSPEQAGGARDIGPTSDMFAFGSLLVFAATGRSPFAADSPAGSLHRIAHSEADLGGLSGRVREAVQACLIKDPAGRPTAAQVRGLLRAADAVTVAQPAAVANLSPPPTLVGLGADATVPGGPVVAPPAAPPPYAPRPYAPPPPAFTPAARQPWFVPAAIVVAVLLVAGIAVGVMRLGAGTDAVTAVAAPTSATTTPDAPTTTASAVPTAAPAVDATVVDAATDGRFGTGAARFTSPSRNIACSLTADQVRCDVATTSWQLPPTPSGCAAAFGMGAVLAGTGAGELSCVSDSVAGPALAVLPYGQGVRFGAVVCDSRESGLRCTNSATGHGFRVARASYDLF